MDMLKEFFFQGIEDYWKNKKFYKKEFEDELRKRTNIREIEKKMKEMDNMGDRFICLEEATYVRPDKVIAIKPVENRDSKYQTRLFIEGGQVINLKMNVWKTRKKLKYDGYQDF